MPTAARTPAELRRGSALVLSLIAVAVIGALGVGLIQLQSALDRRQMTAADRRAALYVAEAGIAEASLAVSQGRSGEIASEERPAIFGDGIYWVESESLVGGRILLTVHAAKGGGRFSLQAMVMPNVSPVGEYGFFGDERVEIGFGAMLDGYDSSEGSYAAQVDPSLPFASTGEGVEIYSNGDIVIAESPTLPHPDGLEAEGGAGDAGAGATGGDVSTPLWDSISTAGLDPNTEYALRATAPKGADTGWLGALDQPTMAAHFAELLGGELSQAVQELNGWEFVAYTESGQVPITFGEWAYLRHRNTYGASVEEIEAAHAAAVAFLESGQGALGGIEDTAALAPEPAIGTRIFGEAVPGPEGFVSTSGEAHVSEVAAPRDEDLQMPPVVVPGNLRVDAAARLVAEGETFTYTAEDAWVDALQVQSGGTLVLEGPLTLGVSTLDVAALGVVVFDDSAGPVRLYTTDRLDLAPGSVVSSPAPHESAFGTHVFVGGGIAPAGDRVSIAASGEFHGVLYAPDDDLVLPNTLRFFGAAAGNRLFVQDWAQASYDRSFATDGAGVPSLPKILSWQVVPIEEGQIQSLRFDPILTLRMQGIEPIPSAEAAAERDFEATYLDAAGELQTYVGDAAAFAWSDVSRLTSLRWTSPATGQPLRWTVPSGYDPQGLVSGLRADERMRVYGTEVSPHPSGVDAEPPLIDRLTDTVASVAAKPLGVVGEVLPEPSAEAAAESPAAEIKASPPISDADLKRISEVAAETPAPSLELIEQVDLAVATIEGVGVDVDGDGVSSTMGLELDGSVLRLTISEDDLTDPERVGDMAALITLFGLLPTANGQLEADVGNLANTIDGVLESNRGGNSEGDILSGLGSVIEGLDLK